MPATKSQICDFLLEKKQLVTPDWLQKVFNALRKPEGERMDLLVALAAPLEVAKLPGVRNRKELLTFMSALASIGSCMHEVERLGLKPGVFVCTHPGNPHAATEGTIQTITKNFHLKLTGVSGTFTPIGTEVIRPA